MAPLKVLIIGAGIGGNAVAFWLAKLKYDVTVVERHPCLRVNGLQLDLRGHGIKVMRIMGLEDAVRAKVVPEEGFTFVDEKGRRRAFFAANKSGKGAQGFTSEFEIMRGDLCQILHDAAVKNGAKYIFGTQLQGYQEREGLVEVDFANGAKDTYSLVIGADGLYSHLRRLILYGPDNDKKDAFVDLKQRTAYFTMPKPIETGEQYIATGYIIPDKKFVLTRRHNPQQMQVYLTFNTYHEQNNKTSQTMRRGDAKSEKDAFAKIFQNSGWKTNELVKAMQEGAEDWYCQYTGFVKIDKWSKGHVALLGDAAHGAPADGMGTSAALLGAYVLAGELAQACGTGETTNSSSDRVLEGIAAYEKRYQPYVAHLHKDLSDEPGILEKIPSTPFTISLMLYAATLISFLRLDKLLSRMMPIEGFKSWEFPEYKLLQS